MFSSSKTLVDVIFIFWLEIRKKYTSQLLCNAIHLKGELSRDRVSYALKTYIIAHLKMPCVPVMLGREVGAFLVNVLVNLIADSIFSQSIQPTFFNFLHGFFRISAFM